jgi:hypothetical protein
MAVRFRVAASNERVVTPARMRKRYPHPTNVMKNVAIESMSSRKRDKSCEKSFHRRCARIWRQPSARAPHSKFHFIDAHMIAPHLCASN